MSGAFFDYPLDASGGAPPDGSAFLAGASDADWAAIRDACEVRIAAAGELVLPDGERDASLYIVVDGEFEAIVREGSRHVRRSRLTAGSVIGEIAFLDGGPRSAAVVAATDATLLRLHRERFEILATRQPALGRTILFELGRVVASRLREIESLRRSR